MPGHVVHDIIGVTLAVPMTQGIYTLGIIITGSVQQSSSMAAVFAISHIFNTIMLSPDMDIDSSSYYRWGVLRWLWWPYKHFVPHRSRISHSAVGGIIRMMYALVLWTAACTVLAPLVMESTIQLIVNNPYYLLVILVGSASASWIHVVTDKIGSKIT